MVALKLVFVSLLSALVATALPVPQVGPAPADSTDVATDGATVDSGGFLGFTWKRQVAPAADDATTTEGATEDWLLPDWKRQVAPPADDDTTTTGATADSNGGWTYGWKRDDDTPAPVAPAAAAAPPAEDDTTTGATVDNAGGGFGGFVWKRDDDTPAPVAPAPADSTTEEGDFHVDSAGGGFGGFVWKKRDDAVAPVARV